MTLNLTKLSGEFQSHRLKTWINLYRPFEFPIPSLLDGGSNFRGDFCCIQHCQHSSFSKVEGPWTAFRVVGQLDFSLTGILSRCSTLLADAKISVFAVSTFDTDYFLVRKESEVAAISAWRLGGIIIDEI
jgi:hypothetical protein